MSLSVEQVLSMVIFLAVFWECAVLTWPCRTGSWAGTNAGR